MKTLFMFFIFLIPIHLFSTIINVPADQQTIQSAIEAAVDADTVLVQPGTYYENINYNGKNITVASLFLTTQDTTYISQTVIDGNQSGTVVTFMTEEDSTAVLSGFIITNGCEGAGGGHGGGGHGGGGIYCNNSSPSLENLKITNNSSHTQCGDAGAGLNCINSNLSLEDVLISDNHGGGFFISSSSNPILQNVIISNNVGWDLGGFYCNGSSPILINVTISDNFAGDSGGGIYCENSDMSFFDVTISGNSAAEKGGGIFCDASNLSFDPLNRCDIALNYACSDGCDLFAVNCGMIDVLVDTFTVLQPDDYFACPIGNFTFDILNAKVEQVNQDLYVSPTGSDENSGITPDDPLLTIQLAITKILPDIPDTLSIHLSNGIYSSSTNGEMFPLYCRSFISLIGEDEISTILDGEDLSKEIICCFNDNNFSIENLTIQNCGYYNGSILCKESSPELRNLTISNNETRGINCVNNSNPILTNLAITDNFTSGPGGGIYCNNSSPTISNSIISGNNAGSGGGICCFDNSSPTISNSIISGNNAGASGGGGICCSDNSNPSLLNVSISNNTCSIGGGIYCSYSSPSLTNVLISQNNSFLGGGIGCRYCSNPLLMNVIISENSAGAFGGGISCDDSDMSLFNVTISSNNAANGGGGISSSWFNSIVIMNCILWDNQPQEISDSHSSVIATYSNIQGGWEGEGNIDEDPLFVGTGNDPYSIFEDSPCIDTGTPDTLGLNLPPYDIIGNERIWDGDGDEIAIIDMGAYEYGAPPYVEIDDDIIVQTPGVHLYQNYPNPFNPAGAGRSPATTIRYQLAEVSKVSLKVYNIKGQLIKTLLDETKSAGEHSIIWDGKDQFYQSVSSGIYFYRLKTKDDSQIKKMVLMK